MSTKERTWHTVRLASLSKNDWFLFKQQKNFPYSLEEDLHARCIFSDFPHGRVIAGICVLIFKTLVLDVLCWMFEIFLGFVQNEIVHFMQNLKAGIVMSLTLVSPSE